VTTFALQPNIRDSSIGNHSLLALLPNNELNVCQLQFSFALVRAACKRVFHGVIKVSDLPLIAQYHEFGIVDYVAVRMVPYFVWGDPDRYFTTENSEVSTQGSERFVSDRQSWNAYCKRGSISFETRVNFDLPVQNLYA